MVTAFLLFLPLTILQLRSVHSGGCTAWLRLLVSFGVMPKKTKQIADCEAVVLQQCKYSAVSSTCCLVALLTVDSGCP